MKTKKAKGIIARRNLNEQELREYLELVKLCNQERWKSIQMANNTALIPDGLKQAGTQEAIANVLENAKNHWISQVLSGCGVPIGQSVNINSVTGVIEDAKPIKSDIKIKVKK